MSKVNELATVAAHKLFQRRGINVDEAGLDITFIIAVLEMVMQLLSENCPLNSRGVLGAIRNPTRSQQRRFKWQLYRLCESSSGVRWRGYVNDMYEALQDCAHDEELVSDDLVVGALDEVRNDGYLLI